jgi:hypothetical protein
MPLPDKQTRRVSRKGVATPRSRPLERPATGEGSWAELEDFLEVFDRGGTPDETIVGHRFIASGAPSSGPGWLDVRIACANILRRTDPENKGLAQLYLRWYAGILGAEVSMDILRDHFGPAILKQSLAKKRGPTAAQGDDDRRIHVYVDAIRWRTGESGRAACERLAKMGLRVRKDATSGRAWVGLSEAETIRKRYMRFARDDANNADIDLFRLLRTWHQAGEPVFLNWLKAVISKDSSGP